MLKALISALLIFTFSEMRNVTFTVELDNDRLTDDHDLRRMFFFQDNKTSFSITQQISLTKENEWYCKFLDTAFLRVSYAQYNSVCSTNLIYFLYRFSQTVNSSVFIFFV